MEMEPSRLGRGNFAPGSCGTMWPEKLHSSAVPGFYSPALGVQISGSNQEGANPAKHPQQDVFYLKTQVAVKRHRVHLLLPLGSRADVVVTASGLESE